MGPIHTRPGSWASCNMHIWIAVWLSRTPLIRFHIVEMHVPDRVLLQFGMLQHIPDPVEAVERVTMQGKADQHWPTYHDKHIKEWENRLISVVKHQETGTSDPTHARNCYVQSYPISYLGVLIKFW